MACALQTEMDDQVSLDEGRLASEETSEEEPCDNPFEELCNMFHFLQSEGCEEDLKKCNGHCSKEWLDILGNGQLKKRVLREGQKDVKPTRGDICTIKIVGCLHDGKVLEKYDSLSIQLGDYDVVQGLDLTIVLMELGEIAEVLVNPRFAYGKLGDGDIPPNATIIYTVELKEIKEEPDIGTMSMDQRRELGDQKRQRGNWWFVRKEFNFSIQCYRRSLEYLLINDCTNVNISKGEPVTDSELQILLDDGLKVFNNLGAALIETGSYYTALDNVNTVLKYQPQNTKALYRKGKIYKAQGQLGKAYVTFLEAQRIDPEMKSINVELMNLKERIAKETEKEKQLYAKMLGIHKEDDDDDKKNVKTKNKSKIAKGILWTLIGASAAVVGILVHRFTS